MCERGRETERDGGGGGACKSPSFKIRKMSEKQRRVENAICGGLLRETWAALIGEIKYARKSTGVDMSDPAGTVTTWAG